jgi:hypothetical protein
MEQQLRDLLERTLRATESLANAAAVGEGKYLNTLLGIYRISFTTLRDIYYLSPNEGTGPSILDLARKIIEHGISVEYMLWKGKEEKAELFQEYLAVQMHDEIEFLRSIGQEPSSVSEEMGIGVEENERAYTALNAETKKRKTWAGKSAEQMLIDLHDAGIISDFDASRVGRAYVWGSRLNHPNPMIVHSHLESEENRAADKFCSNLGILMAVSFHIRLATRLIDESRLVVNSNVYPEIAAEIEVIQTELNTMN